MASGDTINVLNVKNGTGTGANYATPDTISDASTPPIVFTVLDFDGGTNESYDWVMTLPSYYAGTTGLTFSFKGATDGTQTALIEMQFRVLKIADLDILTADLGIDTQTAVAVQDTPPATPTNKFSYSTTGALAKANYGSAVKGDRILIRCTRNTAAATNTDDFQLEEILVTET